MFDSLAGTSNFLLAGALTVLLADGYEPVFGDSFILFDGSAVDGTFGDVTLPGLAGNLEWVLNYNPGDVTLFVTCPGDCNEDGVRNILDFVCFQALFVAGDPGADCDGNGVFNILDFVCFQQAFVAPCE